MQSKLSHWHLIHMLFDMIMLVLYMCRSLLFMQGFIRDSSSTLHLTRNTEHGLSQTDQTARRGRSKGKKLFLSHSSGTHHQKHLLLNAPTVSYVQ